MIHVPFDRLPLSVRDRHAVLRNYFCDKDAEAVRTTDGWALALEWPGGDERHVDPHLRHGIKWWGAGIDLSTMAFARRRTGRILSALYDSWTLHSWSQWLAKQAASAPEGLVVLHVDDHRDLASPRLFLEGNAFHDAVSGAQVEIANPDSVQSAILSGAIGMGSFLAPFLHALPKTDLRHLCQRPKVSSTHDYKVVLTTEPDTLLDPGALRPAIRLEPHPGAMGAGCCRITPDAEQWLEGIGPGPILLHIDMDYFNNRYDGDTDWLERENRFDPTLDAMLAKIDEVTNVLQLSGAGARLEDIVIAYSPGFFPAEFWSVTEARLRSGLDRLYGH